MDNMQKRVLRFVLDNYSSSYEVLLEESDEPNRKLAGERLKLYRIYALSLGIPVFNQVITVLDIPVVNQVAYIAKTPGVSDLKYGTLYLTT